MRLSSQEVNRQAAEWALKLDAGPLTSAEQSALEGWLVSDVRHPGALGRAIATLARVDRYGAVGINALPGLIVAEPSIWTRRRLVIGGGAAATLAAATVAGVVQWRDQAPEEFVTKIGETCTVNLSDGSTITLNTDTKVTVAFTKQARNVRLVQGEAMFHVAKDKARPFVVAAAETRVRAVGTAFNVRLLPQRPIQILVEEGVVEVTQRNMPDRTRVRAGAGTKASVSEGAAIAARVVSATQVARDLAWQHGQLEFNNETLASAAEEFARYSGTKIAVDPAVADRTITGSFAAKDPVGFARVTAAVLELRFTVEDNQVRISR